MALFQLVDVGPVFFGLARKPDYLSKVNDVPTLPQIIVVTARHWAVHVLQTVIAQHSVVGATPEKRGAGECFQGL